MSYTPPKFELEAFNCPHCNAYAHQTWLISMWGYPPGRRSFVESYPLGIATQLTNDQKPLSTDYAASQCAHCKEHTLWYKERVIYPNATSAPLPDEDMPDNIKNDFEEARQVYPISSRSSAALLRLVIQKLSKHLGYRGDLNKAIGDMVANGLAPLVQQALDAVRVIGNESVHPGQIDLRDDPDTAFQLFNLVNIVIKEMITRPHQVQEIYSKLPQEKLQQIEQRDKRAKPTTHP